MNETEKKLKFNNYATNGDIKNVVRLLKAGMTPTSAAISLAASEGHRIIVELLLGTGKYNKVELGICLIHATEYRQAEIAQLLLHSGADPNAGTGDALYRPVLLVAAEKGYVEFVNILLEHGANPNAHDLPVCADLLGIDINQTALIAAAVKGRMEIVRLLLEAGADPSIKGIKGKTAYELVARRKDRQDIAELLLSWKSKKSASKTKPSPKIVAKASARMPASNWKDALEILQELCGTKPTPHLRNKKIQVFALAAKRVKELVKKNKAEPQTLSSFDYNAVLAMGKERCASVEASVFLSFDNGDAQICVAPWGDKFRTIAAVETGSANYGLDTKKLIAVLKKVDALCPFDLCECGTNSVGGSFTSPVKDAKKLAAILFGVCPFVVEEHSWKLAKFERHVKKERRFKLWWD